MNTVLGLCLSTNDFRSLKAILLPSLEHALPLVNISTWLVNFQPPYTKDEIDEVVTAIKSHGFKVRYSYNEYDTSRAYQGYVPMCKIRNDTAKMMPEALIYGIIDDDMSFKHASAKCNKSGGSQYLDAVRYMIDHKKCGVVTLRNRRSTVPIHQIELRPTKDTYTLGKGLLLRNSLEGRIVPDSAESVMGYGVETLAVGARFLQGLYPAELHGARIGHNEYRQKLTVSGSKIYHWDSPEILESNMINYIQTNYNEDYLKTGELIPYEDYLDAGGVGCTHRLRLKYSTTVADQSDSDNLAAIYQALYERSLL